MDGINLSEFIQSRGGRVSIDEAAPILLGILDGLAYAHRARIVLQTAEGKRQVYEGIVHRDLSPQNILLARERDIWIPKITDFKLSKSFESAGITNITNPENILGTLMYWPREQLIYYKHLNSATDVFSIAAVFYEMLTGSWVREGFQELFDKCKQHGRLPGISDYTDVITTHPPIPICERNPNILKPLANVIDRALREKEIPHDNTKMQEVLNELRYPDAGAFRDALLKAFKDIGVPESPRDVPEEYHDEREENMAEETSAGSIVYSTIKSAARREVALLVLDVVQSTQHILNMGDTRFSRVIGSILRRVKTYSSSSDLSSLF